jgi:hypothetical protein
MTDTLKTGLKRLIAQISALQLKNGDSSAVLQRLSPGRTPGAD